MVEQRRRKEEAWFPLFIDCIYPASTASYAPPYRIMHPYALSKQAPDEIVDRVLKRLGDKRPRIQRGPYLFVAPAHMVVT